MTWDLLLILKVTGLLMAIGWFIDSAMAIREGWKRQREHTARMNHYKREFFDET